MKDIKIQMLRMLKLSCFMAFCAFGANQEAVKPDVRLLIDISGSMKKNDPANLRIPALQLVTNLMPKGADAGVWAFGRYVNMLVPLAPVDEAWQRKAEQAAKKINSAGLYTNIGGVLEKASYGWAEPNPAEKRSMILLTDGMVDISKDASVNAKERKKIIEKILPKLVAANVAIHTVALSDNADHELLRTLSTETDGWYRAVNSPEELQKVFLKIFEQSAARDSLPLENNRFNVDASIEEMTLLVFKQKPLDQTKLLDPEGNEIASATDDGSVRWFTTSGYDLITVKSPTVGEWQIVAEIDPDNRVMVVSNLSLDISPVPNNLLAGEAINYQVGLLEEGELISKAEFLELVDAKLIQIKAGETNRMAMFYDGASHQFKQNFFTSETPGMLELVLEVKSPTFERTRNHAINIYGSPLEHLLALADSDTDKHSIAFTVRDDIVEPGSLKVNATVTYPSGEKKYTGIDELSKPLLLDPEPAGGEYVVALDIKGVSVLGREFSVSPEPIRFSTGPTEAYLASQKKPEQPEVSQEPEIEEAKEEPLEEEKPKVVAKEPEKTKPMLTEPEEEPVDWMLWVYIGLGANAAIVLLGFFAWKLIKKKRHQASALMVDELAIDDDEEDDDEDNKDA